MVEGTHTSEALYNLPRARGRGPKLWAGLVEVSDGETIDTGLDTIESVGGLRSGAPASEFAVAESISGGIITFGTGQLGTVGTTVADVAHYIIVVGAVK